MRKVELSMNEDYKYQIIKELSDHDGNIYSAAVKLNCSVRTVYRYIAKYKTNGKAAFIHKNKHRKPVNSLPQELTETIIRLYKDKYYDCNFCHFQDLLSERENIRISYASLYNLMTANDLSSPKIQRRTRKERAKKKYLLEHPKIDGKQAEDKAVYQLALEDAHPKQERCKYFGEEIQMDAPSMNWFGDTCSYLHLSIDNATGIVTGAYFDCQETLSGYYHTFLQIIQNYGIPHRFKTDNRTVFNYESSNRSDDNKDVLTQFGYACRQLGVTIETTSVSQAKGMIERANQSFQGRLAQELRLAGITTIEEANRYLCEVFIPSFNKHFASDLNEYHSVFEPLDDHQKINLTLAVISPRKFDNGSSIKYKNKYYQLHDSEDRLVCFKKGTECLVIKSLDENLYASVGDSVYALIQVPKNKKTSEEFDVPVKKDKPRKVYIPPMSHPWKRATFLRAQEKAHKHHQFGF